MKKTEKDSIAGDPLQTPVMRQYLEIKDKYPDAVLFFRMGDFYEMFLDDAAIAAPIMDVAITRRQGSVPMAGVPYHSCDTYIARLIAAGKKVAIAEQQPDPDNPRLMRRSVRRVISQGTIVEDSLLKDSSHNYLMGLVSGGNRGGAAFADISTGDFFCYELASDSQEGVLQRARDLISRFRPSEIALPSSLLSVASDAIPEARGIFSATEDWKSSPTEGMRQIRSRFQASIKGLGYESESSPALGAVSLILHCISVSFPGSAPLLAPPVCRISAGASMFLDEQTIRNLDLVSGQDGSSRSLFGVLDFCSTSAGKRFLKDAILSPSLEKSEIEKRLQSVEILLDDRPLRNRIEETLGSVRDLERITARLSSSRGFPRDFESIRSTLKAASALSEMRPKIEDFHPGHWTLSGKLKDLSVEIARRVVDEPPAILGGASFIRSGVREDLDLSREAQEKGSAWVADFEEKERKRTGAGTLKVKYNRVVGYFIEVSKAQAVSIPDDYRRKQTLVGNERFTCDALEELEVRIGAADEEIARIEKEEFESLSALVLNCSAEIKAMMEWIAALDFIVALATAAQKYSWTRPRIENTGPSVIEDGRHPVVEKFLPSGEDFIPNSLTMDESRSFAVLTGPNMAGKSTFIRQVAIIQLLAQIGSFVPAKFAVLPLVDRIFTRIGAQDNLTRGESTFYVEMLETARILNQCTDRSLIVMDEVGRGTSTYDGMSLAWAIAEHLTEDIAPKTLFATHYHELTSLSVRPGIFNLTMDVQDVNGRVLFLHRVREGAADRSYGIHVAQIAGLPVSVIERAQEKLRELEEEASRKAPEKPQPRKKQKIEIQPDLF